MKKLLISILLISMGTASIAQDTAYVSNNRTTALFFNTAVNIIGKIPGNVDVIQKENALITLKARSIVAIGLLKIQEVNTGKIVRIPIVYSYGRAGRNIRFGQTFNKTSNSSNNETTDGDIARELAGGNRDEVVDHKKVGGVKAWVNKISLARNRIFFRLDIRNKSKLPYEIDFVRFYIRDLKTVARMATHEQEILPTYSTLGRRILLNHKQEVAKIFGFKRFSLSDDQALNIEIYERNGNRHLYLQIKQDDLNNLKVIRPEFRSQSADHIALTSL